jgi:hypothetical protein
MAVERFHEAEGAVIEVRPRMDILSVFITPCMKPTACHCAISSAVRTHTSASKAW